MLMSVIARQCESVDYSYLSGARVLITGLTSGTGFDLARGFADHGARLIIQSPEDSPEMTELAAVLAENSAAVKLFNDPLVSDEQAVRLVQAAVQEYGGLDIVINLVSVPAADVAHLETQEDVEGLVLDALRMPLRLTECAANRMRLVWVEGSILNIVRMPDVAGGRAAMLADVLRAELQELTRAMANAWAEQGIRINAVAPPSSVGVLAGQRAASDADLAAFSLQLASRQSRSVSGYVLDAEGASQRWC
jgi:NAD(P)-dependent dehydrogenase (short-subunit alcohol dehydrogenase family)